jgi:hypothetical protein
MSLPCYIYFTLLVIILPSGLTLASLELLCPAWEVLNFGHLWEENRSALVMVENAPSAFVMVENSRSVLSGYGRE